MCFALSYPKYRVIERTCIVTAEIVAKEIEQCSNLVLLNLDGNTVGVAAAKRISESLSTHGEFKRAIWKNMFTSRTKEEIPDALVGIDSFQNTVFEITCLHNKILNCSAT